MASEFVKVAEIGELADGTLKLIATGYEDILLVHITGQYFAIDNECTHAGGLLQQGILHPETCEIQCPRHGGRFDLRTGYGTAEPCYIPVRHYTVRIEGSDILVGPPGS